MSYKSIVTVLTDFESDRNCLEAAITLTRAQDAHLEILCLGVDTTQPGFYYAGASAMLIEENLISAQSDAEAVENAVEAFMANHDIRWSSYSATAQLVGLPPYLAHRMRFADVAVLPLPYADGRGHVSEAIVEAGLFNAGVPVLAVPDGVTLRDRIETVVIAWNESNEALTAARRSMPLLRSAERANIALIAPPTHGPERSDPGGQLCQLLVRHGIKADVSVLARTMPQVSDVICRQASDLDADLIVMGAYGHSRFRESILGGATRNMLQMSKVPVLLAH